SRVEGEWRAGRRGRRQGGSRRARPSIGPGTGEQDAAAARGGGAPARARSAVAAHVPRGAGARLGAQRRRPGGGCVGRGSRPMSTKKHAVKVMIGGDEYTVRSDLPPEYTRDVAAYVDQALKKVLSQGPIVETHKAAILAALDITNELFQARKGEREVAARLAALADDLARLLPPGKRKAVLSSS